VRWWPWNRGGPGYWGRACRQNGPTRATRIFRGTPFQWRRCVRTGTSTAPWPPMKGGYQGRFTPRNASCGSLMAHCAMRVDITDKAPQQPKSLRGLYFHQSGRPDSNWGPPAPKAGALPDCATPRSTLNLLCFNALSSPLTLRHMLPILPWGPLRGRVAVRLTPNNFAATVAVV
jgi:hypothetical protein